MHGSLYSSCALAHPNIAFIKYWGNRDPSLHIPVNGSISMNLGSLFSQTRVTFNPSLDTDQLILNGSLANPAAQQRTRIILEQVRQLSGMRMFADVESWNNFPTGAGIASSASGFAALAVAASAAAGLNLSEAELSRLARQASGSACRSVPAGFTEWQAGFSDQDSYAFSIAPEDHWNLQDCIAIISREHKTITSLEGHNLASSSPLQAARIASSTERLRICRTAIQQRDFAALAEVTELDSFLMHAVMMTSTPSLFYWMPATVGIMQAVTRWRQEGLPVCWSIDAGPNVHVICEQDIAPLISHRLSTLEGVETVLNSGPGGAAHLIPDIPD